MQDPETQEVSTEEVSTEVEEQQPETDEVQSTEETSQEESSPSNDQTDETEESSEEAAEEAFEKPKPQKRVPLNELQKERSRRREEQQRRIELEERLEQLEQSISSVTTEKQKNELLQEVQEELGVDGESAAKLDKVIRKYVEASKPKSQAVHNQAMSEFQSKAKNLSARVDDWGDYTSDMMEIFQKEYQIDPQAALENGPRYYYNEAKRRTDDTSRQEGRREMADKINSKNLAVSESSKTSSVKPKKKIQYTRALIAEKKGDLDWWNKHREAINKALLSGEIK